MSRPRRDPAGSVAGYGCSSGRAPRDPGTSMTVDACRRPERHAQRDGDGHDRHDQHHGVHDPDRRCQRNRAHVGQRHDGPADAGSERGAQGEHQLKGRRAESLFAGHRGLEDHERQHRVGEPHPEAGDRPANASDEDRHPRDEHERGDDDAGADEGRAAGDERAPDARGRRPGLDPRAGRPGHGRRRQGEAAERDAAAAHLDDAQRDERLRPEERERDGEHDRHHGRPPAAQAERARRQQMPQRGDRQPAARDAQQRAPAAGCRWSAPPAAASIRVPGAARRRRGSYRCASVSRCAAPGPRRASCG